MRSRCLRGSAGVGSSRSFPCGTAGVNGRTGAKKIRVPLFPGYCFARFDLADRGPLVKMAGVVGIVGTTRGPEPIDEHEVQDREKLVQSRLEYDPHPAPAPGT